MAKGTKRVALRNRGLVSGCDATSVADGFKPFDQARPPDVPAARPGAQPGAAAARTTAA